MSETALESGSEKPQASPEAGSLEAQRNLPADQTQETSSVKEKLLKRLSKEVDGNAGYLPLLVCCFVTGLTDGTLYNGKQPDPCLRVV
jgi:hypothetical protein